MADESIVIEIKDGVDSGIAPKIRAIADNARDAYKSLAALTSRFDALNKSAAAIDKLAVANERLAAAQHRSDDAAYKAAVSQERLNAATAATAAAQSKAALAAQRLADAQQRAQERATRAADAQKKAEEATKNQEKAFNRAGLSAKQYAAAMRGVPAQITDIVVSLQGGQRPLTVLLQQGGQLKDMFGGIGPAARALTSGLVAMINPTTVLTAAFVAFGGAMAVVEGRMRELNGLAAQFEATGRIDVDKTFIGQLRKSLELLPGVGRTAATEIIAAFAEVRTIGKPILEQASQQVSDLATALGTDAPKAAKFLADALESPLKGAEKLDKALGFLTKKQFETIQALEKAGKTAQAQQLILDSLNESIGGLSNRTLTPFQKSVNELGNAWSRFTGALDNSSPIQNATAALGKLLEGLASLLDKLTNFKPPEWMANSGAGPLVKYFDSFGGTRKASGVLTNPDGTPVGNSSMPTGNRSAAQLATTESKTKDLKKDVTAAENRAVALAKVTAQLQNELTLLEMLGDEREKQEMFDRIEESFIGRKIKLTDTEKASVQSYIDRIVDMNLLSQERNRIYNEAIGPQKNYNAAVKASDELLKDQVINQSEYNKQVLLADDALQRAVNPLFDFNKGLRDELALTKFLGNALQDQTQLQQAINTARAAGQPLSEKQIAALTEEIVLVRQQKQLQSELNTIYEQTKGALESLQVQTDATNKAYQQGLLNADAYSAKLVQLQVAAANVRLQMPGANLDDVALSSLGRVIQSYQGMLTGLSNSFGDFFTQFNDGFADSVGRAIVYSENLGDALGNVAREAVAGLISSLVKLGVQYALNAALGQSISAAAAATTVATTTATAAAAATAWAPAAALASLATLGTNAAAAAAGILATTGIAESVAALSSAPGFMSGGYTGNMPANQPAGIVHGKEFVFDAPATNRIGVANLEALRSGASGLSGGSRGSTVSTARNDVNVVVENYGTPQSYQRVQGVTADEVRLIARDVVATETDQVTAGNMANPNSRTRKSMSTNTNVSRRS